MTERPITWGEVATNPWSVRKAVKQAYDGEKVAMITMMNPKTWDQKSTGKLENT
jgi:hypothetical protein